MLFNDEYNDKYEGLELQIRGTWDGKNGYPFQTITLFKRKGRYKMNNLFLTYDKNLEYFILIRRNQLLESTLKPFNNKELAYHIEKNEAIIGKIDILKNIIKHEIK